MTLVRYKAGFGLLEIIGLELTQVLVASNLFEHLEPISSFDRLITESLCGGVFFRYYEVQE